MTTGMTENYALRCYSDIMLTGYLFAMEFGKRCDAEGIPHAHYMAPSFSQMNAHGPIWN